MPHPTSLELPAADDRPGPALRGKHSCTYRPADDRFRAYSKDDQNISAVTCLTPFFRILLVVTNSGLSQPRGSQLFRLQTLLHLKIERLQFNSTLFFASRHCSGSTNCTGIET